MATPLPPSHPLRRNNDLGAVVDDDGGVAFRVWAPSASALSVAGAFSGWAPLALHAEAGAPGTWSGGVPAARTIR
jgi:1,4-alpha-glucan branching enzyme